MWSARAGSPPCHDEAPPGRDHGRLVELQPERVGRRHRRDDHLEPLERQRPGGQRGLRGPPRRQRRRPGLPRLPRGPELAGPEQFGDFLEGTADREAGGVQAAEAEAVAGDLGDGRLDRDARDPGGPPRPPPPGQSLNLVRAEQAGPAVRGLVPAEQAAADVGMECGGLDAEPPGGRLVAAKNSDTQLGFALLLKFYGRFGKYPRGRSELHDDAVEFVAAAWRERGVGRVLRVVRPDDQSVPAR